MRNELRRKLYNFLHDCQPVSFLSSSGGAAVGGGPVHSTAGVVIIDEIEKMAPGSLDVSLCFRTA
jgi:hypothetical protein